MKFLNFDGLIYLVNRIKIMINKKADRSEVPTKVGQLTNDKKYVTESELGNAGYGDMVKSVYDKNDNGIVDRAEVADNVEWGNVSNKPTVFPPRGHTHNDKENKQYQGPYTKLAEDLPLTYPKQQITHGFGRSADGWPFPYCGVITYAMYTNEAMIQYAVDYQNNKNPTGKIKVRLATYNNNSWGEWFTVALTDDIKTKFTWGDLKGV